MPICYGRFKNTRNMFFKTKVLGCGSLENGDPSIISYHCGPFFVHSYGIVPLYFPFLSFLIREIHTIMIGAGAGAGGRRNIRDMPYGRRHHGYCALERLKEYNTMILSIVFFMISQALPPSFFIMGMTLLGAVNNGRQMIWNVIDPVNPANRNRGLFPFSDTDTYRHLRFRKEHLLDLLRVTQMPAYLECGTDERSMLVPGEYCLLLYLYRSHYPSTLVLLQNTFGREYSQLSRIYNATINFLDQRHRHKIVGNIAWYRSRFDMYNYVIQQAMAVSPANPNPGQIPVYLRDIYGFIDGTARRICRPWRNNNAQFPFWNGYYHSHCLIYLGISFPDGMITLTSPFSGHYTDTMCWRDCTIRYQIDACMNERVINGQPVLKLYGDKIFNTCNLITAAFSLRNGPLLPWMVILNRIMSPIRVSIEWVYSKAIARHKHADYRE